MNFGINSNTPQIQNNPDEPTSTVESKLPSSKQPLDKPKISRDTNPAFIAKIKDLIKNKFLLLASYGKKIKKEAGQLKHLVLRKQVYLIKKLSSSVFAALNLAKHFEKGCEWIAKNHIVRKFKDILEFIKNMKVEFFKDSVLAILIDPLEKKLEEFSNKWKQLPKDEKALIKSLQEELNEISDLTEGKEFIQLRNLMVGELLTKEIVTLPLNEGLEWIIPTYDESGKPVNIPYSISYRLLMGTSQIPVYLFLPVSEKDKKIVPPILVFRGTRFDFSNTTDILSIIENLNKRGPARDLYEELRDDLKFLLKSEYDRNHSIEKKIRVLGYSQGGVLAQRAIVDFYEYINLDPLYISIFFNSPGVENDYHQRWELIPKELKPGVLGYVVSNDVISKYGKSFIGDLFEIHPISSSVSTAHYGNRFLEPGWEMFRINKQQEEKCQLRAFANQLMTSTTVEAIYKLAKAGVTMMRNSAKNKKALLDHDCLAMR